MSHRQANLIKYKNVKVLKLYVHKYYMSILNETLIAYSSFYSIGLCSYIWPYAFS